MPGGRRSRFREGPYDVAEIARRIERRRKELGIPAKRMAAALGLYESGWSKKVNCRGSTFTVDEISAVWGMLGGRHGWPFISEEVAEFLDHHLGRSSLVDIATEHRITSHWNSLTAGPGRPKRAGKAG